LDVTSTEKEVKREEKVPGSVFAEYGKPEGPSFFKRTLDVFKPTEKEMGKPQKLKPITQKAIDEIKEKVLNLKDKPKTAKEAEKLAEDMARKMGFDPNIRARE